MFKKKLYYWASDTKNDSGEGILANNFLISLKKKNKVNKLVSINNNKTENFSTFYSKYLKPLFAIIKIRNYNKDGFKTCYVNYLPLWNIFLFIFLPKQTILGPISGTIFNKNQNLYLNLRYNLVIKPLYKISIFFLFKKWDKIYFSTNMLSKVIPYKFIKRCHFNYILESFDLKKKQFKKNKKILFYYRNHPTKYNSNLLLNLENLSKIVPISIVGDKLGNKNFNNYGKVTINKYKKLLANYKFTFNGLENLYSVHFLQSLKFNMIIFCDINLKKFYKKLKSRNVFFLDFSKKNLNREILNIIKKKVS